VLLRGGESKITRVVERVRIGQLRNDGNKIYARRCDQRLYVRREEPHGPTPVLFVSGIAGVQAVLAPLQGPWWDRPISRACARVFAWRMTDLEFMCRCRSGRR